MQLRVKKVMAYDLSAILAMEGFSVMEIAKMATSDSTQCIMHWKLLVIAYMRKEAVGAAVSASSHVFHLAWSLSGLDKQVLFSSTDAFDVTAETATQGVESMVTSPLFVDGEDHVFLPMELATKEGRVTATRAMPHASRWSLSLSALDRQPATSRLATPLGGQYEPCYKYMRDKMTHWRLLLVKGSDSPDNQDDAIAAKQLQSLSALDRSLATQKQIDPEYLMPGVPLHETFDFPHFARPCDSIVVECPLHDDHDHVQATWPIPLDDTRKWIPLPWPTRVAMAHWRKPLQSGPGAALHARWGCALMVGPSMGSFDAGLVLRCPFARR